jgi:hypothetical protein
MKYAQLVEEVTGEVDVMSFVKKGSAAKGGAKKAASDNTIRNSGEYDRLFNWVLSFFVEL